MAHRKYEHAAGEQFGKLTVIAEDGKDKHGAILYKCSCGCGSIVSVPGYDLRKGNRVSCGCNQPNRKSPTTKAQKHGLSKTPEYNVWSNMIQRCNNASLPCYSNYGGRGIKVCDSWRQSFATFYRDMGPRPSDQHSIERDDVDGDYEPSNCRWATEAEQNLNRRGAVVLTWNGKTQHIRQWGKELGVHVSTLLRRYERGWNTEQILTAPINKNYSRTQA